MKQEKQVNAFYALLLIVLAVIITAFTTLALAFLSWLGYYGGVFAGIVIAVLWFCLILMYYYTMIAEDEKE